MPAIHPSLPPLIPRIAALKVDDRGYPIPFFVAYIDGKPDFRIADPVKLKDCVTLGLCWTCGQSLGKFKGFLIGPMCGINHISSEPPSHVECCNWAVRGCPFMTRPAMKRREDEITEERKNNVSGLMIEHNPGVMLLWVTTTYKPIKVPPDGGVLFQFGDPITVTFWREARTATRAEILVAMEKGLPILKSVCAGEKDLAALEAERQKFMRLLPAV